MLPEMHEELFEPAEYIDQRGPGFFTVAAKPKGVWNESSYELQLLPAVVKAADPDIDTYITQAVFNQQNRRATNMQSVGLLFTDLDTYDCPGLRDKSPETQTHELAAFCQAEGIPLPSIVLFSGRGLQAKWLLTEAIGAISLPDWNITQNRLCTLLEPFAADKAAKDISRVLRLDHTVNTKSGIYARVVYTSSGVDTVLARYDFQELSKRLAERFPVETPKQSTRLHVVRPSNNMTFQRLNWYRLYDLRDLWTMRGGVTIGHREVTLFWQLNFLLRAEPGRAQDIWKEAQSLAGQIDRSAGWYHDSDLSTVYRKARELRDGNTVEYQGRKYPPLYTPKNQTLIDLFSITSDEEKKLRTIISKEEKYRRKVEKRRAAGMRPQLYKDVRPWEAEGISRAWWYRTRKGNE